MKPKTVSLPQAPHKTKPGLYDFIQFPKQQQPTSYPHQQEQQKYDFAITSLPNHSAQLCATCYASTKESISGSDAIVFRD
jgi:hypothetical protein